MSAAKIIGIAVKTATIRELAHERPDNSFKLPSCGGQFEVGFLGLY